MKYKEAVKKSMEMLAEMENVVFMGYNISFGSQGYGTLKDIPKEKKIETPVAENLMIGLATGMALEGYHPVVFFERHDFMLNALDGIVNHLSKIEQLSLGEFNPSVIIRAAVGSKNPLNPGIQHIQDFSRLFKEIVGFPVYTPKTSLEVGEAYNIAKDSKKSVMIIEWRDLYDKE
jgi:pyruvate/2-oxoglutarate/acetoin dehydrogenase E1 component